MDFENENEVSIQHYIEMIGQKTGDLLGASFAMGALMADVTESDVNKLYEFGKKTGVAFQIQDDILDLYGDKAKVGKQIGGDILANKKTYLWIRAFEKANVKTLFELNNMALEKDPDRKIKMASDLFNKLGVKADAEHEKLQFQDEALGLLDALVLDRPQQEQIKNFALKLLTRED